MATFNVTGSTTDNLKGTAAGDDFVVSVSAELQATDKIDGKAGTDILKFTNGGGVADSQFTGVISVETVEASSSFAIKLGAFAAKAGVNLVDGTAVTDTLNVNAASFTNVAGITVLGSKTGADNVFTGSQFGDRFTVTDTAITGASDLDGGAGIDTLIFNAPGAGITNNMFLTVQNFEVLAAAGSAQWFEFGNFAAAAGLSVVDGTNASVTLTVDASAHNGNGVTVRGINKDTTVNFGGSAQDDLLVIQSTNTAQNTFAGGGQDPGSTFGDVIQYVGDGKTAFTVDQTQLANVTDVRTLRVTGAPTVTVNLGTEFDEAGLQIVDGSTIATTLNVDASTRLTGITILSGLGVNNLKGTIDSDTFVFTSKGLLATDIVAGGGAGDQDRIEITDKAAILDAVFAKVTKVEELAVTDAFGPVADYTGAKVVLGALSVKSGITTVSNETDYALNLDASARGTTGTTFNGGSADDIFIASTGLTANDTFNAGAGNDSLRIKLATFTDGDVFNGGNGIDEIRILDSLNAKDLATKIVDDDFDGLGDVERLVFDATGAQDVTLANEAISAGLEVIDGSKVTGGLNITATGFTASLDVYLGTGKDSYVSDGIGGTVFVQSAKLNADDTVHFDGGLAFTDAVKITDKFFDAINDGTVTGAGELFLTNNAAGQTFAAGGNFGSFVDTNSLLAVKAAGDSSSSFTFDFTAYNGSAIFVGGGQGKDVFIGGPSNLVTYIGGRGDDSFRFTTANIGNFAGLNGGDGTDEWVVLDAGANPGPFQIIDSAFAPISFVETLRLAASKTGSYDVQLDANAFAAGIEKVDASLAGVAVRVEASAGYTGDLTVLAGAKNNAIIGGVGNDTVAISASTFKVDVKTNENDTLDGGDGADTLKFTTGGVVAAKAFDNTTNFEYLQLADAGNTVTLSNTMVTSVATTALAVGPAIGSSYNSFDFIVQGGKGADTVDGSNVDNTVHVGFVAGAGTDKLTGTQGSNTFFFTNPGDLTAADKVDGGDGFDWVTADAGVYTSDLFKGFKHLEEFDVFNLDATKGSSVTIKNDFFNLVDAFENGSKEFLVWVDEHMTGNDTIDGSTVTGSLNRLLMFGGSGGDDTLIGGAGADEFRFRDDGATDYRLTDGDKVNGGSNLDTISLENETATGPTVLDDSALENVISVEKVLIFGGQDVDLTLADNAMKAGISEVDAGIFNKNFTLDATDYDSDHALKVTTAGGDNDLKLGAGDDTVVGGGTPDANDKIDGGAGRDRFAVVDVSIVDDSGFGGMTNIEIIALRGGAPGFTATVISDTMGVDTIDASQGQHGMLIDASVSNVAVLNGTSFADTIFGGLGGSVFQGGEGGDQLQTTGGTNSFLYLAARDSHLGPDGGTDYADFIVNWQAGDQIVQAVTGSTDVDVKVGTSDLLVADTPLWFTKESIVAQFDGTDTNVYFDADGDGDFDVATDMVIRIAGDQTGNIGTAIQSGTDALDPLKPALVEDNPFILDKADTYDDDDFSGILLEDSIQLTATAGNTKGNYTLTLGANSEQNDIRFIDGRPVAGKLTIDASDRGAPVYIASGSGVNDLTGTIGNDVFYFTSAGLSATDKVNGFNPTLTGQVDSVVNQDVLFITDKSTLIDTAFTNVKNVSTLEFGASPLPNGLLVDVTGQKVVLGLKSQAAGIDKVINDHAVGLIVDASARTEGVVFIGGLGDDVFITNADNENAFFGGGGNDSFRSSLANFNDDQHVEGGVGFDEIRILDSDNGKSGVNDVDFSDASSIERLAFDAVGKQIVTLDNDAGDAGIVVVDGAKVTGGLTVTVGNSFGHEITVIAGSGKDTITLGDDGGDILIASTKLTKDDDLDGGGDGNLHFTDAVKLTDAYFGGIKDAVSNFVATSLEFDNDAKGQSLVAGVNFADFINNSGFTNVVAHTSQGFTADFSAYPGSGKSLSFIGGEGADTVTLDKNGLVSVYGHGGDDTIKVAAAGFIGQSISITGEDGNDQLVILDAGTLDDLDFAAISSVEALVLGAAKSGEYHLTDLGKAGTGFVTSGITTIDGSKAGVLVDIGALDSSADLTLIAGAKVNSLSAGTGSDTFVFDAKTFDGGDDAFGGTSANGDTLKFSTGGAINTAAFNKSVFGIEKIAFSDAGNSLVVTQAVVDQATVGENAGVEMPDGKNAFFGFTVLGGKGNDTVDASALTSDNGINIFGNGGADKFTGGAGEDQFLFMLAGDLTSADTVKGGADFDTLTILAGTYKADAFKGVSGIERISVFDPNGESDASIALNNDFFKGIDPRDGFRTIQILFDGGNLGHSKLDLSAVTDATASVEAFMGAGDDSFIGGAGRDRVTFSELAGNSLLDGNDTVNGGLGWDTVAVQLFSAATFDDSVLSGLKNVEQLDIGSNALSVTLTNISVNAGIQLLNADHVFGKLDLDATGLTDGLVVRAGTGTDDEIALGGGDDVLWYDTGASLPTKLDKGDTVDGGDGVNTLRFSGDTTLIDEQFQLASSFQKLELRDGTFDVTLDALALSFTGITTVDASKAGLNGGLDLHAQAFTIGLRVTGSADADTIETGAGNDLIIAGSGGDTLKGNGGFDSFTYTSAADSFLISAADESHVDTIVDFTTSDSINLVAFGLIDTKNVGTAAADLATATATPLGFFGGNSVLVKQVGADSYVFADTNKDNNFDFNSDLVIKVVGATASDVADGTFLQM